MTFVVVLVSRELRNLAESVLFLRDGSFFCIADLYVTDRRAAQIGRSDEAKRRRGRHRRGLPIMTGTMKSVDHALAVLEFLAGVTDPQTLTALSQRFNMPKSSMHRLLATLRARGYVVKDPINARYGFGLTATRLAQQAGAAESLTEACGPAMRWLWKRTDAAVQLAVRDGGTAVIVERFGTRMADSSNRVMPLHAVSTGLALLAYLPNAEVNGILASTDLVRFTPNSPRSIDAVRRDLRLTRLKGYAVNREYFRDGVCDVAAPIYSLDPYRPVAAMALSVPVTRFDMHLDAMCELVVMAAGRASGALTMQFETAIVEPSRENDQVSIG
jgi:DNA-binding IclR family transcriptional regulator